MKKLLITCSFFFTFLTSFGQTLQQDTIKTSAECETCKERIESSLNYTKGVKFADLNPVNQLLVVRYNPEKISLEAIKKQVSDLGYDADEIKASPEAQKKLPGCCQPGAHHH
jgi:cation transport ATPase